MLKAEEIEGTLLSLLADSGAAWRREGGLIRLCLQREGMVWEVACRCFSGELLVYGRWPFSPPDEDRALRTCSSINSRVVEGAAFLQEDGYPVFRTTARLYDIVDARERCAHALEYNGAVIARFWGEMSQYDRL